MPRLEPEDLQGVTNPPEGKRITVIHSEEYDRLLREAETQRKNTDSWETTSAIWKEGAKPCGILSGVIFLACSLGCAYGYENNNDEMFTGFLYGFLAVPLPFAVRLIFPSVRKIFLSLPMNAKIATCAGFVVLAILCWPESSAHKARVEQERNVALQKAADDQMQRVFQDEVKRVSSEREGIHGGSGAPASQTLTEEQKDAMIMESYDAIFREILRKRLAAERDVWQNQPIRLDEIKRVTEIIEVCRAKTDSFLGIIALACVGDFLLNEQLDANGKEIMGERADEAGRLYKIIGEVNVETQRRNKEAVRAAGRLNANGEVIMGVDSDPAEVARGAANMRELRAKRGLPPMEQ